MTRDASLDEFLGGGDAAEEDTEPDADATESPGDADESPTDVPDGSAEPADDEDTTASEDPGWPSPDADAVTPARSTYAWSPAGANCAACGATVERRWRDEAGLVCSDCKGW
jgi:hypothetical protein